MPSSPAKFGPGPDRDQAPVEVVERGERPREVGVVRGQPGALTADVLAGTGRLRKPASVDPAVEGRDGRSEGLDERRDRCGDAWAARRWRCVPNDGAYLAGALGQAVEQRARALATDRRGTRWPTTSPVWNRRDPVRANRRGAGRRRPDRRGACAGPPRSRSAPMDSATTMTASVGEA
jgi:hypothetical protein